MRTRIRAMSTMLPIGEGNDDDVHTYSSNRAAAGKK